jgi:hypothetical protein
MDKKVENLWLERDQIAGVTQFAPFDIEYVVTERECHRQSFKSAPRGLSRKRQGTLKDKSSRPQSLPRRREAPCRCESRSAEQANNLGRTLR